jgi:hypothetical protein
MRVHYDTGHADCHAIGGVQVRTEAGSSCRAPGRPLSRSQSLRAFLPGAEEDEHSAGATAEYSPRLAGTESAFLESLV